MKKNSANVLKAGLKQLEIPCTGNLCERLLAYVVLINKWNQAYNLTAIRDPKKMITHHILDSLAIASYVVGQRVLDVGAGAGLPGIPLAMVFPEKEFTLLDSNGKKTRFLVQAVSELGLENVSVVRERVERYQVEDYFDCIVTRAFASLGEFLEKASHLCCKNGQILAMKGKYPEKELAGVVESSIQVHAIEVPFLEEERHLVVMGIAAS